jgi:hypothetical protein
MKKLLLKKTTISARISQFLFCFCLLFANIFQKQNQTLRRSTEMRKSTSPTDSKSTEKRKEYVKQNDFPQSSISFEIIKFLLRFLLIS